MREAMTQAVPEAMLEKFVEVFCGFWSTHRLLLRRIHGIGAIDPEFGAVLVTRNQRRLRAATRIVSRLCRGNQGRERAAVLMSLTSFEFFDALMENLPDEKHAHAAILELARTAVLPKQQ
jgi:hypothetical protein